MKKYEGKQEVGPQSYNPTKPQEPKKGMRFGTAERVDEATQKQFTPAPDRYNIQGDFDFRDPNNLNDRTGKLPKFAFGIKHNIK